MNGQFLKFEEIENGKILRVSFIGDDEAKREFLESLSEITFYDLAEYQNCNGWLITTADQLNQLSSCLVLSQDYSTDDNGEVIELGKAWSNFHNYQIVNEVEEILTVGYYDFRLWE